MSPQGYATKAQMLDVQPSDVTDYVTSDYEVKMLGNDYAVMAHKTEGYSSLHVFCRGFRSSVRAHTLEKKASYQIKPGSFREQHRE